MNSNTPHSDDKQKQIWQVIQAIPMGKVATYGQVAKLAGLAGLARYVGFTLKNLPEGSKLPWHRVVNAQGRISFPINSERFIKQYHLLVNEGVIFNNYKISLEHHLWCI